VKWSQIVFEDPHADGPGVAAATKLWPVQDADEELGPIVPDAGDEAFPAPAAPRTMAAAATTANS
jgi:hypothetical protein